MDIKKQIGVGTSRAAQPGRKAHSWLQITRRLSTNRNVAIGPVQPIVAKFKRQEQVVRLQLLQTFDSEGSAAQGAGGQTGRLQGEVQGLAAGQEEKGPAGAAERNGNS